MATGLELVGIAGGSLTGLGTFTLVIRYVMARMKKVETDQNKLGGKLEKYILDSSVAQTKFDGRQKNMLKLLEKGKTLREETTKTVNELVVKVSNIGQDMKHIKNNKEN